MSNNAINLLGIPARLDGEEEEPIPLPPRIVHKFYEPIVLLVSLLGASKLKGITTPPPPDPPINIEDLKQVFQAYVNKLGHVCDSNRGGDTVTSFLILNRGGTQAGFRYWFAANRQTNEQLENTVVFVKALLHRLGRAPMGRTHQHTVRRELLSDILRFNRPRVSIYLRALQPQAQECLGRCYMEETDESKCLRTNYWAEIIRRNLLMFALSGRLIIREFTGILDSATRDVGTSPSHPESECKSQTKFVVSNCELYARLRRFITKIFANVKKRSGCCFYFTNLKLDL